MNEKQRRKRDKGEVLIGILKLVKAAILIALAFGALSLVHRDAQEVLAYRFSQIGVDPDNNYIQRFLEYAGVLSAKTIKEYSIGFFIYAALFATEGIGLVMMKRWGEWFTVVVTGSFLPLEVYSFTKHHDGVVKIIALLLNIAILVYLILRIRKPVDQK